MRICDAIKGAELLLQVGGSVAYAIARQGADIRHLRMIPRNSNLLESIARLVVSALPPDTPFPVAETDTNASGVYLVHFDRVSLPGKGQLEVEFSEGCVSEVFFGRYRWTNHASYGGDDVPGDREMVLKHFNRRIRSEEVVAELDSMGYRPATHLEAYAFAKQYPDFQREFWIVALGSTTAYLRRRHVAVLRCREHGKRTLDHGRWHERGWKSGHLFLAVRKSTSRGSA
jgi:hypothetical protein